MSEQPTAQVRLERIYLKDASWESPKSPGIFAENWTPEVQADINTKSNRVEDTRFEVVLTIGLSAKLGEEATAFIVEVQQAGLFHIEGVEGETLRRVLGTLCPTTLYPYAREAVDNLTLKGGFPALHLAPVNFEALYAEAVRQQEQQTAH
jgi:preprotein translocase subunit SecB